MEYVYIALLLLCSAFCSGTELAYTSLNKLKLHKENEKPTATQKLVAYIYNHYDNALSTILIGNNLVNIAASVFATTFFMRIFGRYGNLLTIVILTPALLIFSVIFLLVLLLLRVKRKYEVTL